MIRAKFSVLAIFGVIMASVVVASPVKENIGLYGGYVADVESFDSGGSSEIFIAVDTSQGGVFRYIPSSSPHGIDWVSLTNPSGASGGIAAKASQIEASIANPTEIYTVLTNTRVSMNKRLFFSSDKGLVVGGAVSWSAVIDSTGAAIDGVELIKSDISGIFVSTRNSILHKPASSSVFGQVFSTTDEIMGFDVFSGSLGYIATKDASGNLSFFETNWGGVIVDLSSFLPTKAPVEIRTSACPVFSGLCPLEIELVGVDPADATGKTVYIAGSSTNGQSFKSSDGGRTWNSGWDYQCSLAASGCAGFGFTDGYPKGDVIRFRGVASSGTESRHVFISRVVLDNDNPLSGWDPIPKLSSTIYPSGSGSAAIVQSTNANDPALVIDPNDPSKLYIATDLAIGEVSHDPSSGWASPSGSEMSNARGIDGLVINDLDYYEISSTNKVLWIAAKSGAAFATGYDPTDPTSVATAAGWVFPIYPAGDGAPPTAVAIDPSNKALALIGNGKVYRNPTSDGSTGLPDVANNWSRVFDPNNATFSGPGEPLESARTERSYSTDLKWLSTPNCDRIYHSVANTDTGLEGGIFYSDDKGLSWTADTLNGSSPLLKMPVNSLLVKNNFIWAGVGDRNGRSSETGIRARLSLCGSSSWWEPTHTDPLFSTIQSSYIADVDGVDTPTSTTLSGVVYIASESLVIKGELLNSATCTSSGFACWQFYDVTPSAYESFSSVVIEPNDPDHVWVAFGNCIKETTDSGATWSDFGGSCVDNHEDIKVLVYDDLIAGTSSGAFAYSQAPENASPVLIVPSAATVEATGPNGIAITDESVASFLSEAVASDSEDGDLTANISNDLGEFAELGENIVTFSVADSSGDLITASVVLTVSDTTAPSISLPASVTVTATSGSGISSSDSSLSSFFNGASASDAVDGNPKIENDAPTTLPIGSTTITFTATDLAGNVSSGSSTITVEAQQTKSSGSRGGGGCSLSDGKGPVDPSLPILSMLAILGIFRRRLGIE